MPVTITYDGAAPTVGGDADSWGTELNVGALAKIKVDLDAGAVLMNATETVANAALPKAGGTMTGDIALGDPAPASASSAGFRGAPPNDRDADYTLALTDAGKSILHTSATPHAWTIPPNSTVALPVGTVVLMTNIGTGAVTVTRGAGVALRINGSAADGNATLNQWGTASVQKVATDSWLISGPVV